jgi:hypothetical protein
MIAQIQTTFQSHGIMGLYKGGTALMLRQGSNWASRQGLTDIIRIQLKKLRNSKDPSSVKLSTADEAFAGIVGDLLSSSNIELPQHLLLKAGRCQRGTSLSKFYV